MSEHGTDIRRKLQQVRPPSFSVDDVRRRHERRRRRQRIMTILVALALAGGTLMYAATMFGAYERPVPASSANGTVLQESRANAAWQHALAGGVVALSREVSLTPWALGHDGRTFFASLYSETFSGVVRVDAKSSQYVQIWRFPNPDLDQAVGSFDGRWLVWNEYHSLQLPFTVAIWSWDSLSGQVRQIGTAERSPSGDFWPMGDADVRDGLATWTQESGPNGLGDVHVVDLSTGSDRIVRHGHPEQSFFLDGGLVAWRESNVIRAADARTGRPVATPPALAQLRGAWSVATDGAATAEAGANWSSLWWSPSLGTAPTRLFTAPDDNHIDNSIQVAGRYICFGVAPHTYLADTVSRRYIEISPGGWGRLDAKSLVLLEPSATKAIHAISDVVFLSLSSLPPIPAGH